MVQLFYYCNLNHTLSIRLNWYTLHTNASACDAKTPNPEKFIG